jgi:hypothetical protein
MAELSWRSIPSMLRLALIGHKGGSTQLMPEGVKTKSKGDTLC